MIKNVSVLLIDDDPITNILSKKLLLKIEPQLQVDIVGDGEEAINYLQGNKHPQLILLVINMEGMDGFEFLANFNSFKIQSRVIVLTSRSLNENCINRLKELGCSKIIVKPITREKFQNQFADNY